MSKIISKHEYKKAIKIVNQYEKKLNISKYKGVYGFLYWIKGSEREKCKYIKAKNIDSAIKQFLRLMPKTLIEIDPEVSINGNYIEIVNRPELKEFF